MLGYFIVTLSLTLIFKINNAEAIYCNFTFVESESAGSVSEVAQIHIITSANATSAQKFSCEQNMDDDLSYTFVNTSAVNAIGNRFGPVDYEDSCISSKRFIAPRLLNNIYNQLTPVLNSITFVQKIQINECRNYREPCNDQAYPPGNYRFICNQEYLTIKLSALSNGGTIFEEDFYIPSACSCRLVRVAKKLKEADIIYV